MADYPNDTGLVDAVGNMVPATREMWTPEASIYRAEPFHLISGNKCVKLFCRAPIEMWVYSMRTDPENAANYRLQRQGAIE
jgi:hypothetical protein